MKNEILIFEILSNDSLVEAVALVNRKNDLQYYSLGSLSLYAIKALVPEEITVYLIENEVLTEKVATQSQLNVFYRTIGIETI